MPKKRATIKHDYRLNCLNKRHRILLMSNGALVLKDHQSQDEIEATQVQEALSGQKCKCMQILRAYTANGLPRVGIAYRQYDYHAVNKVKSKRYDSGMPKPLRDAAYQADLLRDKRYLWREGPSKRHEGMSAITSGSYFWRDLDTAYPVDSRNSSTQRYYFESAWKAMNRLDLPQDRKIRKDYLTAKLAAGILGPSLAPIYGSLYVACDVSGSVGAQQSGETVWLQRDWVSKVYRVLDGKPIVDGHFVVSIEDGDPSWTRALTVRQQDRPKTSYTSVRSINLVNVNGYLFKKPFGDWGFMADTTVEANLIPKEPTKKSQLGEIIAYTDYMTQ